MKIARMLALSAVAFATSISASLAGPCSAEIDDMVARINAALKAPSAQQEAVATQEKVGVLSPETLELVMQIMTQAYAADSTGDDLACKEALAEVQRTIGR
jgi:hypothetical protein